MMEVMCRMWKLSWLLCVPEFLGMPHRARDWIQVIGVHRDGGFAGILIVTYRHVQSDADR